jgi:hypothetical protein
LASIVLVSGCGNSGKLSGKVLYKGQPVPKAQIGFLCDNGYFGSATADDSGNYTVGNLPIGRVRIGVKNFTQGMADIQSNFMQKSIQGAGGKDKSGDIQQSMEGMMKMSGSKGGGFVALPEKAIDPERSGISAQVKGGRQDFDIIVPE